MLFSLLIFLLASANAAAPLRLATFQADVTPPLGSPLCCSAGVKPAAEIVDPLTARGVVLFGAGKPVVLVAVDWEGIANEGWDEWRRVIASAAATSAEYVTVHTLHQHDAPGFDLSAGRILNANGMADKLYLNDFMKTALDRVAAAVREAAAKPRVVTHVAVGQARVSQVASNRRVLGPDGKVKHVRYSATRIAEVRAEPEGVVDPDVRLVSFWNGDTPVATLTYYATHPQSYYGQGGVSADFVGMARGLREAEQKGVPHIHFNGAAGNVTAGKYNDGAKENRPVLARRLADGMRAAWESAKKSPVDASSLRWRSVGVSLPPAEAIRDQARLETLLRDSSQIDRVRLTAARDLAFSRLAAAGRKTPLFLLEIGPASIVHMPGELFVEYQLEAQSMRKGRFVAMAAYGDYGPGYIGTRIAYSQGGYETGPVSRTAPEVEDVLRNGLRQLLR
ncbi:MAG: hypothetical protein JNK87_04025 [Bryobacterales bacterium]|nr:hypothetical protein [Bryobacterales bacterium]